MNFAASQKLPLIAVCENNQYAVETYIGRALTGPSIAERASGFGLPAVQVDGQDVCAVYRATLEAHARAANGGGPSFIEAVTYRYNGHNTGEDAGYRTDEEVDEWRRVRDPIDALTPRAWRPRACWTATATSRWSRTPAPSSRTRSRFPRVRRCLIRRPLRTA